MKSDFEKKVLRKVRSFREASLDELSAGAVKERKKWLQHRSRHIVGKMTPRDAYELFLIDYLGLAREAVPIVSQNNDEIVWDSFNECPTLEACARLGLDTKKICRQVYEKSTQAFLSELDPQLRFWRSYTHIRPYASSCREAIFRIDFEGMMRLALEQAESARAENNGGNGAVIVFRREILAAGHDRSTRAKDRYAHAGTTVIRKAQRVLGAKDLCGGLLFLTREPCSRCMRLAVDANLTTIVFGAYEKDLAALGKGSGHTSPNAMGTSTANWVEIIGGVLREECITMYRGK